MNQIIENAPRQRSRRHGAVEDSGSDSEDTEADEAEWEDILATMGGGEGDGAEVTDDESDTVCWILWSSASLGQGGASSGPTGTSTVTML